MARVVLRGELREGRGKGVARQLRRGEKVPAVIYGSTSASGQPIAVDAADVRRLVASGGFGRLVDLDLGEAGRRVALAKDVQFHPVRGDILHADFHEVDLDEAVQVQVPLQLTGEEARLNDGGILDVSAREILVSCLPTEIPETITVDVSSLVIGDVMHVRDLHIPEGVEVMDDPDTPVLTVVPPAKAAEEQAEAAGDGEEEAAKDNSTEG